MKKRGFTLIELLVALSCTTIVLLLLSTSIFFITKGSNNVVNDSTLIYKIFQLKDYILNNDDVIEYVYDEPSNCLIAKKDNDETVTVLKNVKKISIDFYNDLNDFKCCSIFYTTNNDSVNKINFVLK